MLDGREDGELWWVCDAGMTQLKWYELVFRIFSFPFFMQNHHLVSTINSAGCRYHPQYY